MAKKMFTDESLATFVEETKLYVNEKVSTKADEEHAHDEYATLTYVDENFALKDDVKDLSNYYTKTEIDDMEFITVADIDAICGTNIQMASEVMF
jgi:hypothetical protein